MLCGGILLQCGVKGCGVVLGGGVWHNCDVEECCRSVVRRSVDYCCLESVVKVLRRGVWSSVVWRSVVYVW